MATSQDPTLSRRTLLKTGAGAVAGGTLATGLGTDRSLVGESEAFAPLLAAGVVGAAAVGAGMGWIARDIDPFNQDGVPEGLTPEALKQSVYQTALTRQSTNASTFTDNQNIINYMPEVAFSEAKAAALEAMDQGKSEAEVIAKGETAANQHFVTVEKNFLKSWNETIAEWESSRATAESHPDVNASNLLTPKTEHGEYGPFNVTTNARTLRDGSSFDVTSVQPTSFAGPDVDPTVEPPISDDGQTSKMFIQVSYDGSTVIYWDTMDWHEVWSDMQSTMDQVISDLNTWVSNTYGQVQTGEIDIGNLVTGTDLANTSDVPRAIADLVAANVPADLDNQLTVEMGQHTLSGYLATTDQNALSSVAPGDTIDPNATDDSGNPIYGVIYLATDPVEWRFDWQAWDSSKGVDGGLVWFTRNPAEIEGQQSNDLIHTIKTAAGETATVTPSDFTETTDGSGNTVWEVDLSDQLNNTITTVEKITTRADVSESNYSITQLDETFTVKSTESGDPVEMGQNREPQTDDNYITQEEWDQLLEQQKELIDKYEEAKSGGGGISLPSGPSLPENIWLYAGGFLGGLGIINAVTS